MPLCLRQSRLCCVQGLDESTPERMSDMQLLRSGSVVGEGNPYPLRQHLLDEQRAADAGHASDDVPPQPRGVREERAAGDGDLADGRAGADGEAADFLEEKRDDEDRQDRAVKVRAEAI